MLDTYSGATRVIFIVGDPIAQVKSPAGVTAMLRQQGYDAVVVPIHVAPADLAAFVAVTRQLHNVDAIIVTVPHKMAAATLCQGLTPRARALQAVNTMRRDANGQWFGDMFDGEGFVQAMRRNGCEPAGRRALLVGAGGAGSAIAQALVDAGVAELALHETDAVRRDTLLARLGANAAPGGAPKLSVGTEDPQGFDIVLNATPLGMRAGDPSPVQVAKLASTTFVGCVVTVPAITPLIEAARARGCATMTGADMFACVRDLMVTFLLEGRV